MRPLTVMDKGTARLSVDKRTVAVSVKMSERDLREFNVAARKVWPGAILSRSELISSFARLGLSKETGQKE